MISNLELRSIIEGGFLPLQCQCTVGADGALTVRVYDVATGEVQLLVTGIVSSELNSARAIATLAAELRDELANNRRCKLNHSQRHEPGTSCL